MIRHWVAMTILAGLLPVAMAEENGPADPISTAAVPAVVAPAGTTAPAVPNAAPKALLGAGGSSAPTNETKADTKADVKPDAKSEAKGESKLDPLAEEKPEIKPETSPGWDRYKVLVQRNMFSKDRSRTRTESRGERKKSETPVVVAPKVEAEMVLVGVIQKDGEPAAIIENRSSGKIVTLKPGEVIGTGKIKVISLDSMDFENDANVLTIKIGSTLTGATPKPLSDAPTDSGSSGSASGTSNPLPSPGTSSSSSASGTTKPSAGTESVLERMRRKRQEEMRK